MHMRVYACIQHVEEAWVYVDKHGTCNDPMLALLLWTWSRPHWDRNTLTLR